MVFCIPPTIFSALWLSSFCVYEILYINWKHLIISIYILIKILYIKRVPHDRRPGRGRQEALNPKHVSGGPVRLAVGACGSPLATGDLENWLENSQLNKPLIL